LVLVVEIVLLVNSAVCGVEHSQVAVIADGIDVLPGQPAGLDNYTSYHRGINGIMVDLADLPEGVTPEVGDFLFHIGNDDTSGDWGPAPIPTVTVRAEPLGLVEDDVFCFGNAVAEADNSTTDTQVTTADLLLARNNPRNFLNPAPIDYPYDFNRDGRVNATDVLLARNNQTSFANALRLIDLPGQASPALTDESPLPASEPEIDLDWLSAYEQLTRRDQSAKNRNNVEAAVDKLIATYLP